MRDLLFTAYDQRAEIVLFKKVVENVIWYQIRLKNDKNRQISKFQLGILSEG